MKKLVLVSGILAATSFAQLSMAATGNINFTGELTAATCTVEGGSGGTADTINVPMGIVSIADLGDGTSGDFGVETGVNLDIDCAGAGGLDTVVMNFAPRAGSGIDPTDNRLLKLQAGGATGVGIALINDANNIVDLGAAETVKAALVPGADGAATAKLNLRAAYIKTAATPTFGDANATMPFTLSYE